MHMLARKRAKPEPHHFICASAFSTGQLLTCITPFKGRSISNIKKTEPPIASAQIRNATTTVPLRGAPSPKLANIMVIQDTNTPSDHTLHVRPLPLDQQPPLAQQGDVHINGFAL